MIQLKLTAIQRLNLTGIVNGKRYDDDDDSLLFREFSKQIELPSVERKMLFRANSDTIIPEMIEKLEGRADLEIQVEVEKGTARKVLTRLLEWRAEFKLSPADTDWYIPLKKQLQEVTGS